MEEQIENLNEEVPLQKGQIDAKTLHFSEEVQYLIELVLEKDRLIADIRNRSNPVQSQQVPVVEIEKVSSVSPEYRQK